MTSHPLYQTSYQLYLCQHNLSLISNPLLYDITPTISVTSYALYITSYTLLMSSHYSTTDSKILTYETTSSMQLKIYTILVISQCLVCVITPTVLRASHPLFVWHHTRYEYSIFCTIGDITSTLMKSNQHFYDITPTIYDTVSRLFLSPHPLYWWYHTNCIYEISSAIYVNIISIVYNIFTIFVPSQPLYLCLTFTLSMISHHLYIWHCTHYMYNIQYTI